MECPSCKQNFRRDNFGNCRKCYEEASKTMQVLKPQVNDLEAKVAFLSLPLGLQFPSFSDVVLLASDGGFGHPEANPVPVHAHRAVLASRSPVFRAMLENEMQESMSGTIKIGDVSHDALRSFVHYLYSAQASLDEEMAIDLLLMAEKYQVKHLMTYCEKYMASKLNWENALTNFAFAHQHNAKILEEAALLLILDNMDKLSKSAVYMELVDKDPRLVVEIYEAYLLRKVNTAAPGSLK